MVNGAANLGSFQNSFKNSQKGVPQTFDPRPAPGIGLLSVNLGQGDYLQPEAHPGAGLLAW